MEELQPIIIRQAKTDDSELIWNILHANCRTMEIQQIHDRLGDMRVLMKGPKMLAVMVSHLEAGGQTIEWIEIHPCFPERFLKSFMLQGVIGIGLPEKKLKFPLKPDKKISRWDLKYKPSIL